MKSGFKFAELNYRRLPHVHRRAETEGLDITLHGEVVQCMQGGAQKIGRVYGGPVYVDGLGVGDVGEVVLRDRKHLSADGMIVVTVTVDSLDGKVLAGPYITSRGFAFAGAGERDGVLEEVRRAAVDIMEGGAREGLTEWTSIREHVHKGLQKFIYDRTKRRPMIVPVVMEV